MYAVGTEDMDALTFGSTILLRHLTFSEARKMPIKEFHFDRVTSLDDEKSALTLTATWAQILVNFAQLLRPMRNF